MPHYDPVTDEIADAAPGSFAWEHEQRHREQYRPGVLDSLARLHIACYYAAIIAAVALGAILGLSYALMGVGLGMLPHVAVLAYMEADAYLVGAWRWLRKRGML
jgi:Flp pilus assembly protein TadB